MTATTPDRIVTGRRLIGRESRLGRLRSAIDRTRDEHKPRLFCVTGVMGVGKSALLSWFVRDIGDDVLVGAGIAVLDAGPYSALGAALDGLVPGLMRAPDEVRGRVVRAVGSATDVLLDLAPAWRSLLAASPEKIGVAHPEHVRQRLRFMLQRLFAALDDEFACTVLVIDNLQHADRHTIDALGTLLSTDGKLMVVGAYPSKDVGAGHPLRMLLDSVSRRSASLVTSIDLRPLPDTAVTEFVAAALGMSNVDVQPLSSVLVAGTGSNPLAVEQLMHWLAEQGLLTYDREGMRWTWRLDRVSAIAPAGSRIEAVVQSRLNRLSLAMREALRNAALLGEAFRLTDLMRIARDRGAGFAEQLRMAAELEILRQVGTAPVSYAWAHPLLREVALEGASTVERAAATALLLTNAVERPPPGPGHPGPARPGSGPEHHPGLPGAGLWRPGMPGLFELLARPESAEIRPLRLAELHLRAAGIANGRGATEVAHRHLRAGVEALPAPAWRHRYPLAFALHVEAARAARAIGDGRAADRMLDQAMAHAHDDVDRATVSRVRLVLRWHRRGYGGDPMPGLAALRLLGVAMPDNGGDWASAATAAVAGIHARLSELDLSRRPTTDIRARFTADLIAELLAAVATDPDISAVLAARGVELALDHGPAPGTGYAFAWLGVAVAARRHDEDAARRCAEAAVALSDLGRADDPHAAATKATVALALPFLVGTAQSTLALLREAYEIALDRGDVAGAMASLLMRPHYLLAIGAPVDEVADEVAQCGRLSGERGRYPLGQLVVEDVNEAVARLRGDRPAPRGAERPGSRAAGLDEQAGRGELGYVSGLRFTGALMTAYLLGDHVEAVRLAEQAERVPLPHWAGFLANERHFYHALALSARFPSGDARERKQWRMKLAALRHELERWAEHRPAGFAHKALLVSAEQARLAGDIETAMGRFERVIGGARENGFLHIQAIAAELGGRCAMEHISAADARAYLHRAQDCYQRWGARAKVAELDRLLAEAPSPDRPAHPIDQLDLLNVVKAFQTLSAVLDLEKLTATILQLLVHHAGAQRGCLLLRDASGNGTRTGTATRTGASIGGGTVLRLAAEATVDSDLVAVTRTPDVTPGSRVPMTLIEEVVETRQVVMPDPGSFDRDPYLAAHHPRALLAAPVAHQGRLIGVLYLEHRHRVDAFGPGQLDGLEILCTQAAICLDNAAVYAQLAEANRILDATFERLPVGLILLRPDLTVHRASPHAVRLLGLPIYRGTPLVELIDVLTPVDVEGHPLRLEPALAEIGPDDWAGMHREMVIIRPDGQRQRLDSWSIPLRDHDGRLLGVTLLVTELD